MRLHDPHEAQDRRTGHQAVGVEGSISSASLRAQNPGGCRPCSRHCRGGGDSGSRGLPLGQAGAPGGTHASSAAITPGSSLSLSTW